MNSEQSLIEEIQTEWDYWNRSGVILYRSDTLTTKNVSYSGKNCYLIHNACRDVYDQSKKIIEKPRDKKQPFTDNSNPELTKTPDKYFKILGNKFACMQYQSILVPTMTQENITPKFLAHSLSFAYQNPSLTVMYNALNAGKTVPHQYWLVSFSEYKTLKKPDAYYKPLGKVSDHQIWKTDDPCYLITFEIDENVSKTVELLFSLTQYMQSKSFNIFLFANRVYFIPRENVEIPVGFEEHRFGGLEMIGYFIMKSLTALENANPEKLLSGIQQITYQVKNQELLESYLLQKQ
jgi:hypothetical protein